MPDRPFNVLLCPKDSPALIPSGYGKIARYVAPILMDLGYEVRLHCPVGHVHGAMHWTDPRTGRDMEIWTGGEGPYGENIIPAHLQRLSATNRKPTITLFIGDTIALNALPQLMREGHVVGAAWSAVDWESPTPQFAKDRLAPWLRTWSMSQHGHRVLERDGVTNLLPPLWFGVDTELWKPQDRGTLPNVMASMGFRDDTFNVFSCFANQYQRKSEYEMFLAVSEFAKRHPDAKTRFFCMTQVKRDWDLMGLADTLGIREFTTFSSDYAHIMGDYEEEDVAAMMNVSDCVLSLGYEGFGFQTVEAQALNKPVIGFDAAATPELLQSGLLVPPIKEYMLPQMLRRLLPDEEGIVQALEEVWRSKGDTQRWSKGRRWVQNTLTWNHCAKGLGDRLDALDRVLEDDLVFGPAPPGPIARQRAAELLDVTVRGA